MQVPVVMPQLGLTMTEGSVSEWMKKPGDEVKKNEIMFVVSTDKADMEVEATEEGKLAKIVVEVGNVVPVGTVIAYLERPGEESAQSVPSSQQAATESETPAAQASSPKSMNSVNVIPGTAGDDSTRRTGPPASPRARRLATELGIDINVIIPSGHGSRIVEQDVRDAAQSAGKKPVAIERPAVVQDNRRRVIADKLTESIQTIPHFSVAVEVNVQQLKKLYEDLNSHGDDKKGVTLTLTDLMLKALALAVEAVPEANVVWENGAQRAANSVDLALAVATDRGVVAPALRTANELTLGQIASKRHALVDRARRGKLSVDDLEGGIGTLSNLGMFGVDEFQGIISPGQTFILAVGRILDRPWVEKSLVVRPTVKLNLSMDHRVADGVVAAKLLNAFAELLESPFRIVAKPEEFRRQ